MAKKTVITMVDDIDGTDAVETILFAVDGASYEIDLSADNAAALRDALKPYIDAGRKTAPRARRRGSSAGATPREIRAWAADNGIDVPARGRIPASVQEQFHAANG